MLINYNISSLDYLTNNYKTHFEKSSSTSNLINDKSIIFTNSQIMNKTKNLRQKHYFFNQQIKKSYSTNQINNIYTPNYNSKKFILNYLSKNSSKTKFKLKRNNSTNNFNLTNSLKNYDFNKNKNNNLNNIDNDNKIYKNVFNHRNKIFKTKFHLIDNKLNLINVHKYSHSASKHKYNLIENKEKNLNNIKNLLNTIKNSVSFYKCIIDYTYPEFTVEKNKLLNKSLYKNLLTSKPYYLKIDKQIHKYEKEKLNYLQQSFKIKKLNIINK